MATVTPTAATGAAVYSLHTAQVTVGYALDVWGGTRRQIESLEAQAEALGLPARRRLSDADSQHRPGRDPGGLAARTGRGDAPPDLGADAAARDSAPAEQPGPDRAPRRAGAGDRGGAGADAAAAARAAARSAAPPACHAHRPLPERGKRRQLPDRLLPAAEAAAPEPARRSRLPAARRARRRGQRARGQRPDRRGDRQPPAADHAHRQRRQHGIGGLEAVRAGHEFLAGRRQRGAADIRWRHAEIQAAGRRRKRGCSRWPNTAVPC